MWIDPSELDEATDYDIKTGTPTYKITEFSPRAKSRAEYVEKRAILCEATADVILNIALDKWVRNQAIFDALPIQKTRCKDYKRLLTIDAGKVLTSRGYIIKTSYTHESMHGKHKEWRIER